MKYIFILFLTLLTAYASSAQPATKSLTAQQMDKLGFKNIAESDSSIVIRLMYTRSDNFVGKILYTDLQEAYLHPEALESLLKAQQLLKKYHPGYCLVIYDAARPMSIQQTMWNAVKGTSKSIYVSNPKNGGGLHNYGMAVDISIINEKGDSIPMGTKVDYMGPESHINDEITLVKQHKITEEARQNRLLLRKVMQEAGFCPLYSEWWHFNRITRAKAKAHYKVIP